MDRVSNRRLLPDPADRTPADLPRGRRHVAAPGAADRADAAASRGRPAVRDTLVCLSLANLYVLNVWVELGNRAQDYYMKVPPRWAMLGATIADLALLSLCFLACVTLWRRLAGGRAAAWVAGVAVSAALLVPLNILRSTVFAGAWAWLTATLGRGPTLAMVAATGLAAAGLMVARPRRYVSMVREGLLLLLPLLPVLAVYATSSLAARPPDHVFATPAPSPAAPPDGRRRIVWMLFDEWDQRLVFGERPRGLLLPAVDRLRAEALAATRAVGGGYGTANAVPSMLINRRVVRSVPSGPRELLVGIEGRPSANGELEPLSRRPSLFTTLRAHGWRSTVVDWYHPSCRIFGAQIDVCTWEPGASIYDRPEYLEELTFGERMRDIARRQAGKAPLADQFRLFDHDASKRTLAAEEYRRVVESATLALGAADFVYVHWPVPHPFGIYDRTTGLIAPDGDATYLDNLSLVDRIIATTRSRLEADGAWDDTVVLLSSDHSLRTGEWMGRRSWSEEEQRATQGRRSPYVPFVLKLAGQREPLVYGEPFSIMLTHDLIVALARGDLRTAQDVARWLDANRRRFSVPRGA